MGSTQRGRDHSNQTTNKVDSGIRNPIKTKSNLTPSIIKLNKEIIDLTLDVTPNPSPFSSPIFKKAKSNQKAYADPETQRVQNHLDVMLAEHPKFELFIEYILSSTASQSDTIFALVRKCLSTLDRELIVPHEIAEDTKQYRSLTKVSVPHRVSFTLTFIDLHRMVS